MANINRYDLITVADADTQANGTTTYTFGMNNFAFFTIQIEDTAGSGTNTYSLEASVDGTTYQDVTSSLFGVSNVTTDTMFICDTPCPFRLVKVKVIRSGDAAPGNGEWLITVKRSA